MVKKEENKLILNDQKNLRNSNVEITLFFSYKFFEMKEKDLKVLDKKFRYFELNISDRFSSFSKKKDKNKVHQELIGNDSNYLFYTGVESKYSKKYSYLIEKAKKQNYKSHYLVKTTIKNEKRNKLLSLLILNSDNEFNHYKIYLYPIIIEDLHK